MYCETNFLLPSIWYSGSCSSNENEVVFREMKFIERIACIHGVQVCMVQSILTM